MQLRAVTGKSTAKHFMLANISFPKIWHSNAFLQVWAVGSSQTWKELNKSYPCKAIYYFVNCIFLSNSKELKFTSLQIVSGSLNTLLEEAEMKNSPHEEKCQDQPNHAHHLTKLDVWRLQCHWGHQYQVYPTILKKKK